MNNAGIDVFKALDNIVAYGRLDALDSLSFEKFKDLKIKLRNFQPVRIPTGKLANNGRSEYITKGHSWFTTRSGENVEVSEWYERAKALIKESGEDDIFRRLLMYAEGLGWFKTKEDAEQYALELHISRIFEDIKWVCYADFKEGLKWVDV